MLGAIIGDIVGSRFEFNPTNDYHFELFGRGCSFTDDSICTFAVADALLYNKDFGETLHRWCRRYPNPMGGYGGSFRRWVMSDNPEPYNSFGNGSAMRVSPVAWWPHNVVGVEMLAKQSAECTHNHPEGIKGAQAVAVAIYECLFMRLDLLREGEVPDRQTIINKGLRRALDLSGYDINISADRVRNRFDETCQGTVPVAFWIVSESSGFEDAIRRAVSLGADADTLGAIVGGIAEAIWGIPDNIREQALTYLTDEMRDIVERFYRVSTQGQCLELGLKDIAEKKKKEEQLKAVMFWKLCWGNPNVAMGLAPHPNDPTRPATADDWHCEPMPATGTMHIDVSYKLTAEQMQKLQMGHLPSAQEDHWFMYCTDSYIRIFRSWTGTAVFEAHYRKDSNAYLIDSLVVNEMKGTPQTKFLLFRYLILSVTQPGEYARSAWDEFITEYLRWHRKYNDE